MPERDRDTLTMFTIFEKPKDYPDKFVVRGFDVERGNPEPHPHAVHIVCNSLEEARSAVPSGLYCIARSPEDHQSVVETWL